MANNTRDALEGIAANVFRGLNKGWQKVADTFDNERATFTTNVDVETEQRKLLEEKRTATSKSDPEPVVTELSNGARIVSTETTYVQKQRLDKDTVLAQSVDNPEQQLWTRRLISKRKAFSSIRMENVNNRYSPLIQILDKTYEILAKEHSPSNPIRG